VTQVSAVKASHGTFAEASRRVKPFLCTVFELKGCKYGADYIAR
jgi:hypothetical protein